MESQRRRRRMIPPLRCRRRHGPAVIVGVAVNRRSCRIAAMVGVAARGVAAGDVVAMVVIGSMVVVFVRFVVVVDDAFAWAVATSVVDQWQ